MLSPSTIGAKTVFRIRNMLLLNKLIFFCLPLDVNSREQFVHTWIHGSWYLKLGWVRGSDECGGGDPYDYPSGQVGERERGGQGVGGRRLDSGFSLVTDHPAFLATPSKGVGFISSPLGDKPEKVTHRRRRLGGRFAQSAGPNARHAATPLHTVRRRTRAAQKRYPSPEWSPQSE